MQTETPDENIVEDTALDAAGTVPTPGEVLQSERLKRGLTEKEVADKLHITMHYVRAIEANKFEKLPGAVFAKGYIKSYALLLELDVDAVTVLFDGINSERQEKKEEANRLEMARRRSDRNKPWVYASVACFVLGFAGLWAFNQQGEEAGDVQQAAPVNSEADNTPAPATIASSPMARTASLAATDTAPAVVAPNTGTQLPPATAVSNSPEQPATLATVLTSLAAASPAGSSRASVTDPATANLEPEPAEEAHFFAVGADGDDVLRIRFSGESWVEVIDSEANQIYRDIREAGDILEITGNAPFNILLGDAPFTRLSLNGTEIDVSDDIRIDNSARLTVGL